MKNVNYKFAVTGKNEVIAISSFAGHIVKGKAKCHPEDNFELELGKELAAARCNKKIAEKRYKRARNKYEVICELVRGLDKEFKDSCDYLTNSYEKLKIAKIEEQKILRKIHG